MANIHFQFQDVPNSTYVNKNPAISIQVNKLNNEDLDDISVYCNKICQRV